MSTVKSLRSRISGSARIQPNGKLHLGNCLVLEQHAVNPASSWPMFSVGLPQDGLIPAFDNPLPYEDLDELPRTELQYTLRSSTKPLFIEDDGLAASYGIFGAPGSGKTHLLLYLFRQLLQLNARDESLKIGAIILDPKATLIEDIRLMAAEAGRSEDLIVINHAELEANDESINVIDVDLEAAELARALVLAAQSAGVGASEPYWFGAWQNLFGAAIYLLQWLGDSVLTLRQLLDAVLTIELPDSLDSSPSSRPIQKLAKQARSKLEGLPEYQQEEVRRAINQIDVFYSQKSDSIATVENLITQAYGVFLTTRTRRFSHIVPKVTTGKSFYDRIIDDGSLVLVSVSPAQPGLARVLCTLIKNLFMQSMRSRLDRVRANRLHNFERMVLLACDEYSQVASEIPGQAGDGDFFSIARQQGCMGILATQSVAVLENSGLKESWKGIFSNFGAKIFMRAVDNDTIKQATELAGETDWHTSSLGTTFTGQGRTLTNNKAMTERKVLPGYVLSQLLKRGQGVLIGSLQGNETPSTYFFQVPRV